MSNVLRIGLWGCGGMGRSLAQAELRDWLAALRGEAAIPIPGEEGMATVALAEAAYRSAETGAIVTYATVLGD